MSDLMFPPNARITHAQWTAISMTAVARSIFTGAIRSVGRTGDHFKVMLSISSANDREAVALRSMLRAFRVAMAGQANRCWFGDPSYVMRGSFPCSEMLANGSLASGSTGWTPGSGWTLTVADGFAKLTATSATPATTALSQSITLTTGIAYAVRSLSIAGFGTTQPGAILGTIANSSGTPGMYVASGLAGSTGAQNLGIYHTIPGGFVSGRTFFVPWISARRCALVNGASQTGGALTIDALPISTNGLALPGDFVQVGNQFLMVTQSLDSDSSGAGYLQFKPTLRASPADNDPVHFGFPLGRFALTENQGGWSHSPGGFADYEFELEESLDI